MCNTNYLFIIYLLIDFIQLTLGNYSSFSIDKEWETNSFVGRANPTFFYSTNFDEYEHIPIDICAPGLCHLEDLKSQNLHFLLPEHIPKKQYIYLYGEYFQDYAHYKLDLNEIANIKSCTNISHCRSHDCIFLTKDQNSPAEINNILYIAWNVLNGRETLYIENKKMHAVCTKENPIHLKNIFLSTDIANQVKYTAHSNIIVNKLKNPSPLEFDRRDNSKIACFVAAAKNCDLEIGQTRIKGNHLEYENEIVYTWTKVELDEIYCKEKCVVEMKTYGENCALWVFSNLLVEPLSPVKEIIFRNFQEYFILTWSTKKFLEPKEFKIFLTNESSLITFFKYSEGVDHFIPIVDSLIRRSSRYNLTINVENTNKTKEIEISPTTPKINNLTCSGDSFIINRDLFSNVDNSSFAWVEEHDTQKVVYEFILQNLTPEGFPFKLDGNCVLGQNYNNKICHKSDRNETLGLRVFNVFGNYWQEHYLKINCSNNKT